MTVLVLVSILCADQCRGHVVQRRIVAQPVVQAYSASYAAPVVAAVQYPTFLYVVGQDAKVEALAKIAEQNSLLLKQQSELIQNIRETPQAPAAPAASKLETAARALMAKSCVSCHGGAKPKGGVDLSGPLTTATKLRAANVVRTGEMPPKPAAQLSDDEFNVLQAWATEDGAAVRAALKAADVQESSK